MQQNNSDKTQIIKIIIYTFTKWTMYKIVWEKKIFDPLLILYICPLTKKLPVYNFNARFFLTVRDRITTKKSRKTYLKKSYKIDLHFNE